MTTEPFLLEHSRRSEHEGITGRVKSIREKFENLEGTERVRERVSECMVNIIALL